MAELNEKQLLLLDCLIYVGADYSDGKSLGAIADELLEPGGLDGVSIGASMTKDQVEDLLRDLKNDPALCDLVVDGYMNTEIRGACFVDPNTREAVVVYRGTGPAYAAWDDNCQGGYLSDTDMQKEALEFAQKAADKYGEITVTGHSKGGNMAQYVTVVMGDQVDRCVSFDGQGFGDEFRQKYADEIAANKDKIRSVSAYNDYVNPALTAIAGEIVYLDNVDTMFPDGHYPYTIYKHENNVLVNGEYVTVREQDLRIKIVKCLVDELIRRTDGSMFEFIIYSVAGMAMGLFLNGEDLGSLGDILIKIGQELIENLDDYLESIVDEIASIGEKFWEKIDSLIDTLRTGGKDTDVAVTVDTAALRETSGVLGNCATTVDTLYSQVQKIRRQMASNIISGVAVGAPLQIVMKQLEKEANKLEKLAAFLANSADLYDSVESENEGLVK